MDCAKEGKHRRDHVGYKQETIEYHHGIPDRPSSKWMSNHVSGKVGTARCFINTQTQSLPIHIEEQPIGQDAGKGGCDHFHDTFQHNPSQSAMIEIGIQVVEIQVQIRHSTPHVRIGSEPKNW